MTYYAVLANTRSLSTYLGYFPLPFFFPKIILNNFKIFSFNENAGSKDFGRAYLLQESNYVFQWVSTFYCKWVLKKQSGNFVFPRAMSKPRAQAWTG